MFSAGSGPRPIPRRASRRDSSRRAFASSAPPALPALPARTKAPARSSRRRREFRSRSHGRLRDVRDSRRCAFPLPTPLSGAPNEPHTNPRLPSDTRHRRSSRTPIASLRRRATLRRRARSRRRLRPELGATLSRGIEGHLPCARCSFHERRPRRLGSSSGHAVWTSGVSDLPGTAVRVRPRTSDIFVTSEKPFSTSASFSSAASARGEAACVAARTPLRCSSARVTSTRATRARSRSADTALNREVTAWAGKASAEANSLCRARLVSSRADSSRASSGTAVNGFSVTSHVGGAVVRSRSAFDTTSGFGSSSSEPSRAVCWSPRTRLDMGVPVVSAT